MTPWPRWAATTGTAQAWRHISAGGGMHAAQAQPGPLKGWAASFHQLPPPHARQAVKGRPSGSRGVSASAPGGVANPANSAKPTPDGAGQFAGFAEFAAPDAPKAQPGPGFAPAEFAGFATPPGAYAETPLDPEGLPFAACPACGAGDWWKPAAQPFAGPGWACAACTPPGNRLLRHACAVPSLPSRPVRVLNGPPSVPRLR